MGTRTEVQMKKVVTVAHTRNPKALEAETGGSLRLVAQPGFTRDQQVRAGVTALTGVWLTLPGGRGAETESQEIPPGNERAASTYTKVFGLHLLGGG